MSEISTTHCISEHCFELGNKTPDIWTINLKVIPHNTVTSGTTHILEQCFDRIKVSMTAFSWYPLGGPYGSWNVIEEE